MNRICVYTCITGQYDNLKEINNKEKGIDYYCFTNNKKLKSNSWKIIYLENEEELSDVLLARKTKILGHPIINDNYDILLWMDGTVTFNKKIKDFIDRYLKKEDNFVAFKHGERDNIKDECYACVRMRKETKENITKILEFYRKEKYEFDNGLIESTVYIKRTHNKEIEQTMKIWFDMVKKYTKRDQLSFNYAISKTGLKVKWINEKVFNNNWFTCNIHNYEKNISSYRVYFNDINNEEYNVNNDYQGKFIEKNNNYEINITVPCDTKKTVIELSRLPFIMLEDIKISGIKKIDAFYHNSIKYKGKIFFYNENGAIEIYNELKKETSLKVVLKIITLSLVEVGNLIREKGKIYDELEVKNYYTEEENKVLQDEIKALRRENELLHKSIDEIRNRKAYRIIQKIDKIRSKKEKKI